MTETPELSTRAVQQSGASRGGEVELRVPADSAYVAVLRSVTAGLAARCDLTLDEIEDLRIAVDEACGLILPLARTGAFLITRFELAPGCLVATAAVDTMQGVALDRDGFGWTVLDALASVVEVHQQADSLRISLTKRRGDQPL